jgi:hypothetical protein
MPLGMSIRGQKQTPFMSNQACTCTLAGIPSNRVHIWKLQQQQQVQVESAEHGESEHPRAH